MTTITFPTDGSVQLAAYSEGLEFDVHMATSRLGRITTRTLPGARWRAKASISLEGKSGAAARGLAEALAVMLRGGGNDLALYNPWHANVGTLGATTVKTAAAVGARSAVLNATTGLTVAPGDRLGFPAQRVMVVAAATAASGEITVSFEPELQVALAIGNAVVTVRPTTRFVPVEPLVWFDYDAAIAQPIQLDLVEI